MNKTQYFVLNADFPPLPDLDVQHSAEQSCLLGPSHVCANGSSEPAALGLGTRNQTCYKHKTFLEEGERRRTKTRGSVVTIALCLHLFLQYVLTFRAVSPQQGNYSISLVMKQITN